MPTKQSISLLKSSFISGMGSKKLQIRLGLLLPVVFTFAGAGAGAQTTIAYVSSEAIIERLPQAIEARGELGTMQAKWLQEIRRLEEKIITLRREIEQNRLLWSNQERSDKEGQLRDLEASLASYRAEKFGPGGEFERLYGQLMAPVLDIVMVAVQAEAEEQEYDYVFDKSSRGLPMLFADPDRDITLAVLKRLGVEVDASELEKREEKPSRLLPESFPVDIGVDGNSPISLDPNLTLPQTVRNGTPVEEKVESNPNALLPEKEEESDPR